MNFQVNWLPGMDSSLQLVAWQGQLHIYIGLETSENFWPFRESLSRAIFQNRSFTNVYVRKICDNFAKINPREN